MSIIKKTITILIITFITVFSDIQSVSALDTNNFYFKDATFDYYLEKTDTGSNLHVKEVLTAVFPDSNQNHGITRTIPFTNQGGKNITAESEDALNLTVTRNDNYEPISKTEKNSSGYYTFYIGDSSTYVHGEQVYTLEYDFSNVITEFTADGQMTWNGKDATTQELYWDTNGTGWFQKFNHLTANLHLPANIAKNLDSGTSCYVGSYGASNNGSSVSNRCKVSSNDETTYNTSAANSSLAKSAETIITFETSNLSAGENLTFAVTFTAGTFIVPKPKQSYTLLIFSIVIVALCILIIIMAARKYQKYVKEKKSYNKGLFVKPEYVPPKGLTVAEAGEIYMKSSKPSFVATLLELAVSRKIEIIKSEKDGAFGKKDAWKIKLKSDKDLTDPQRDVLKILNGGTMPAINTEFDVKKRTATTSLEAIKRAYTTDSVSMLKTKGLMEEKGKTVSFAYLVFSFLLILTIPTLLTELLFSINSFGSIYLSVIDITLPIITFIIVIAFIATSSKYGSRTMEGIEVSKELEGLKLYITMAEQDRIKFLQSTKGADTSANGIIKLYEKLLPYAVIFGAEDSWMAELNKYYKEHPEIEHSWYYGTDYLTLTMFRNMTSTTASTIVSSTSYSSSSSSGSGGGGFSGGGGGGGGGGGW